MTVSQFYKHLKKQGRKSGLKVTERFIEAEEGGL